MTRVQFLNELYRRLDGLPQEQVEQHLTYYAEMLADRIEEGMSEEEAVASMEPLDTIVQQILEDVPPENPIVQPPAYPDLPETDGSRFSKVPHIPPPGRRNVARIALWIIAIAVAFGATAKKLHLFRSSDSAAENAMYETAAENALYETETYATESPPTSEYAYVIPKEPIVEAEEVEMADILSSDGIFYSEFVSERYSLCDEIYLPSPSHVDIYEISVKWKNGAVEICPWEGNTILFQEYSNLHLRESGKLQYDYDEGDDTLYIDSHASGDKGLLLLVPANTPHQIRVESTTADICWDGLLTDTAQIDTVSGNITVKNTDANTLSLCGTSGTITLQNVIASELDIENISNDINLQNVIASELDIETNSGNLTLDSVAAENALELETTSGKIQIQDVAGSELYLYSTSGDMDITLSSAANYLDAETSSGDIAITLPPVSGFSLLFDTSSGFLDRGPFSLVRSDGVYLYGNGGPGFYQVGTASGNLYLRSS